MQKCEKCNASWNIYRKLDVCPFCGADLRERVTADSIEAAFRLILNRHGKNVFHSSALLGLIGDYAPSLVKERRLVKVAIESGAYKAICAAPITERKHVFNRYVSFLTDSYYIDEIWAKKVLMWYTNILDASSSSYNNVPVFNLYNNEKVSLRENTINISSTENKSSIPLKNRNNTEIKKLLDDVLKKVTINGPIVVEDSLTTYTTVEIENGIKLDRGFISPYMVQDQEKLETILDEPYILITNAILTDCISIRRVLDLITPAEKSLLIIASNIEGAALSETITRSNSSTCVAVKAPAYGDRRIDILKDIATLTGGNAILQSEDGSVKKITIEDLGQAKRVIIRSEETIIIGGLGDKKALQERMCQITKLQEKSLSDFDKEKLQERFENLNRGVAVIKVGGRTVSETSRLIEEVNATLLALRLSNEM